MRNVAVLLLIACSAALQADYSPTSARLGNWTISTSEDRSFGVIHNSYPIWNMFDGKPETAWVYSGDIKKQKASGESMASFWGGQYAISIEGRAPVRVDEIRIQAGYFKSDEVFRRNNRVTQIAVYEGVFDAKLIRRINLDDNMDWQSIRLPSRPYSALRIVFEGFAKGADDDVAISELDVRYEGKSIGPIAGKIVAATDGSSCGCGTTWSVLRYDGSSIAEMDGEHTEPWYSGNGRFIRGYDGDYKTGRYRAWIIDAKTGSIRTKRFSIGKDEWLQEITPSLEIVKVKRGIESS